jgi:hypothetical protein
LDAKSKIYQIVDYRVRAILDPEKNLVKSRTSRAYHRSSYILFSIILISIISEVYLRLIPGQMSATATSISASNTKNYAVSVKRFLFDSNMIYIGRNVYV